MNSSAVKNFNYHNSRLHFKSRTNQFQKEDTRVTQKSVTDWLARLSCTHTCISILIHFSFILDFVQFHPICIFFIWVQSISSSWSKSHYYQKCKKRSWWLMLMKAYPFTCNWLCRVVTNNARLGSSYWRTPWVTSMLLNDDVL